MTNSKQTKGNCHVENLIKVVFDFAENQYNCAYGLGFELKLQGKSDKYVPSHKDGAMDAANHVPAGRVIINKITWYIPHYIPSK